MAYAVSTYMGDDQYRLECTGDCVVGDEVAFERATFEGSLRKPKFAGFEMVKATIVADSYGQEKQQHTFTLKLTDGIKSMIKGRNLYRQRVFRKPWADEASRQVALNEKHQRGDHARHARALRRELEPCHG